MPAAIWTIGPSGPSDLTAIGQGLDNHEAHEKALFELPSTLPVAFSVVEAPRRRRVSFWSGAAFRSQRWVSNCISDPVIYKGEQNFHILIPVL